MKTSNYTSLVIKYPNGATQIVKPGTGFQGDWRGLAQAVAGRYFRDQNVNFELR